METMKMIPVLLVLTILVAGCTQTSVRMINTQYEKHDLTLTTDDGVVLIGNMFVPATGQKNYPLVILIHQYEADRSQWNDIVQLLMAENYAVLAYDIRGMGESVRMSDGRAYVRTPGYLDEIPLDLAVVLDYANSSNRVDRNRIAVVGASVGANTVLSAKSTYPEIKTAVVISPSSRPTAGIDSARLQGIFYMADDKEENDARMWYDTTTEPRQIKIYPGAGHGIAILNNKEALSDLTDWLSKYL
jgi:dipeptidyl aminopeptidase/acylaminoacyl peptidase